MECDVFPRNRAADFGRNRLSASVNGFVHNAHVQIHAHIAAINSNAEFAHCPREFTLFGYFVSFFTVNQSIWKKNVSKFPYMSLTNDLEIIKRHETVVAITVAESIWPDHLPVIPGGLKQQNGYCLRYTKKKKKPTRIRNAFAVFISTYGVAAVCVCVIDCVGIWLFV